MFGKLMNKVRELAARETTDLHEAVQDNDPDRVRDILSTPAGKRLVNYLTRDLESPLTLAFFSLEMTDLLLNAGADPHARVLHRSTPAFHSIVSDNSPKEVVKRIIDHGANIQMIDDNGNSLLHEAAWHNNTDAAELFLDAGLPVNALNTFEDDHRTPLHHALLTLHSMGRDISESIGLIRLLLERGANVHTPFLGQSPIAFVENKLSDRDGVDSLLQLLKEQADKQQPNS